MLDIVCYQYYHDKDKILNFLKRFKSGGELVIIQKNDNLPLYEFSAYDAGIEILGYKKKPILVLNDTVFNTVEWRLIPFMLESYIYENFLSGVLYGILDSDGPHIWMSSKNSMPFGHIRTNMFLLNPAGVRIYREWYLEISKSAMTNIDSREGELISNFISKQYYAGRTAKISPENLSRKRLTIFAERMLSCKFATAGIVAYYNSTFKRKLGTTIVTHAKRIYQQRVGGNTK
jgi:hypothetical protein